MLLAEPRPQSKTSAPFRGRLTVSGGYSKPSSFQTGISTARHFLPRSTCGGGKCRERRPENIPAGGATAPCGRKNCRMIHGDAYGRTVVICSFIILDPERCADPQGDGQQRPRQQAHRDSSGAIIKPVITRGAPRGCRRQEFTNSLRRAAVSRHFRVLAHEQAGDTDDISR